MSEKSLGNLWELCGRVCGRVSANQQNIHSRTYLVRKQNVTYTLLMAKSCMGSMTVGWWLDDTHAELQPSQQANVKHHFYKEKKLDFMAFLVKEKMRTSF